MVKFERMTFDELSLGDRFIWFSPRHKPNQEDCCYSCMKIMPFINHKGRKIIALQEYDGFIDWVDRNYESDGYCVFKIVPE